MIDKGPYALVRHPMYAGFFPFMVGMALWLESYGGAIVSLIPMAILIARITIEERFLKQHLPSYEAYTKRVRYRLIPYLW